MKNGYFMVGVWILVLALGAGCGSNASVPPGTSTGGAPVVGGPVGTTPQLATGGTTALPTAGSSGTGTAGKSSTAGSGAAAGSSAAAGSGAAAGKGGASGGGMGGTTAPDAGMSKADSGMMMGAGTCCKNGDCLCHGDVPSMVTSAAGPFKTMMYDLPSAGCVFYPTDADPPYAAVVVSDGFGGSGGCAFSQTGDWGPLYASWGIVTMIIHTGAGDDPPTRGDKLTAGIAAYKMEDTTMSSPLFGKLSGRYGTSGFSMGGGGTTFTAQNDPTLRSNVAIMAWAPSTMGIMVPSLYIFGSADTLAGQMGMPSYDSIPDSVPKMAVTIQSPHSGEPGDGGGASGEAGLAFQKVFLEGDERWRPLLLSIMADKTNIK